VDEAIPARFVVSQCFCNITRKDLIGVSEEVGVSAKAADSVIGNA
jgi:hypothetical protein